jgi:putative tributyrin esterase
VGLLEWFLTLTDVVWLFHPERPVIEMGERMRNTMLLMVAASLLIARPGASQSVRLGDSVQTASLGVTKHIVVYLPPSYASRPESRYPVVYLLNGLEGSELSWFQRGIRPVADSLIREGMPETILVAIDGDDGWYSNWITPTPYEQCASLPREESASSYCVRSSRYADYIRTDVVAHVDATYRTRASPTGRGLLGNSMGGYGALKLALQFPDIFGGAASLSGAMQLMLTDTIGAAATPHYANRLADLTVPRGDYLSTLLQIFGMEFSYWQENDPAYLVMRAKNSGQPLPAMRIVCGTGDDLRFGNRALHGLLQRAGIAHAYEEREGGHNWQYWRSQVPSSLRWLVEELAARDRAAD